MKFAETRAYSMSDAELCQFASDLVVTMTRDEAEFIAKGITVLERQAFQTLGNAFEVFPNDAYYLADVMIATETKRALRASLEIKLRDIVGLAAIKWGQRSPQVKRFDAGNMTKDQDRVFLTLIRQGVVVATQYLPDLTAEGLTLAQITAMADEGQDLEDALNEIGDKERDRDIKTRERIDKGNELYGYVAKYCEIGKLIFQDTDPAKYNDYIIYEIAPGVPGKILSMSFESVTQEISWAAEPSANAYELQFSVITPQLNWVQIYIGPDTHFIHPFGPSSLVYRCRGKNDNGVGYWSDNLIVTRV